MKIAAVALPIDLTSPKRAMPVMRNCRTGPRAAHADRVADLVALVVRRPGVDRDVARPGGPPCVEVRG